MLASLLIQLSVTHELLNARPENIQKESQIISIAGRPHSITIATNMVGRGTDIKLGGNPKISAFIYISSINIEIQSLFTKKEFFLPLERLFLRTQSFLNYKHNFLYSLNWLIQDLSKNGNNKVTKFCRILINKTFIFNYLYSFYLNLCFSYAERAIHDANRICKLGGLYVIGTEKFESRRIDYQLRGRCGRQGDPGQSAFFLSLEDKVLRLFGGPKIGNLIKNFGVSKKQVINKRPLTRFKCCAIKVNCVRYPASKQRISM